MVRLTAVTLAVGLIGAPGLAAAPLARDGLSPSVKVERIHQRGRSDPARILPTRRTPGTPRTIVLPHAWPTPRGDGVIVPPLRGGIPTFKF